MTRILAFGASTSSTSINKKFAHFAAQKIKDVELILIDLNDFEAPLFSVDLEKEEGFPESIRRFRECLGTMDALVISLAEHNGNYTAAFKNLMDWMSRIDENSIWLEKTVFLLSTSPGKRGGKSVHDIAMNALPRYGANITASFSLPSFNDNFSSEGITDEELKKEFEEQLQQFVESL
ncbi:MAG: NADPH-dependent FMN reductase [Bacteroidetes bacterium]|nr:MAG: NADPH-dependent FMN reductase [Bacteroidota bacterium]